MGKQRNTGSAKQASQASVPSTNGGVSPSSVVSSSLRSKVHIGNQKKGSEESTKSTVYPTMIRHQLLLGPTLIRQAKKRRQKQEHPETILLRQSMMRRALIRRPVLNARKLARIRIDGRSERRARRREILLKQKQQASLDNGLESNGVGSNASDTDGGAEGGSDSDSTDGNSEQGTTSHPPPTASTSSITMAISPASPYNGGGDAAENATSQVRGEYHGSGGSISEPHMEITSDDSHPLHEKRDVCPCPCPASSTPVSPANIPITRRTAPPNQAQAVVKVTPNGRRLKRSKEISKCDHQDKTVNGDDVSTLRKIVTVDKAGNKILRIARCDEPSPHTQTVNRPYLSRDTPTVSSDETRLREQSTRDDLKLPGKPCSPPSRVSTRRGLDSAGKKGRKRPHPGGPKGPVKDHSNAAPVGRDYTSTLPHATAHVDNRSGGNIEELLAPGSWGSMKRQARSKLTQSNLAIPTVGTLSQVEKDGVPVGLWLLQRSTRADRKLQFQLVFEALLTAKCVKSMYAALAMLQFLATHTHGEESWWTMCTGPDWSVSRVQGLVSDGQEVGKLLLSQYLTECLAGLAHHGGEVSLRLSKLVSHFVPLLVQGGVNPLVLTVSEWMEMGFSLDEAKEGLPFLWLLWNDVGMEWYELSESMLRSTKLLGGLTMWPQFGI